MGRFEYDIGILGGGSAGLTIAAGAAQLGAKTLLVEKKALGGDCLYFGCVPSKTLIHTARVYHSMKHTTKVGLPAVTVPPVDYREVTGRIQSVIGDIEKHDSMERFCKLGVHVEIGSPVFTDAHSIRVNGKHFSSKCWAITTGSSPSVPKIPGFDTTPYLTNRDLFSMDRLPRSMIMIGGGPIGIEMAQAFRRLGSRIMVIQRGDQILGKEDKDMADAVMNVLASEGVEFYMNAETLGAKDRGAEKELTIKIGEAIQTLRAEAILTALGRDANLDGLGLEQIGVHFDKGGLKVDDRLRTNLSHIYAAGDTTGNYQFTHAAGYEGGVVLANAIFRIPKRVDYTLLPWCTYTDPELASIGMNEKAAKAAGIRYTRWIQDIKDNDRSLAEGEETGKIKMLLDEKERPIGVQILGSRAGELVSEWVAVMNGHVKLTTLASSVHPYPTLGEINRKVAATFLSRKIFSESVRKGLRFFFHLKGRACVPPDERIE